MDALARGGIGIVHTDAQRTKTLLYGQKQKLIAEGILAASRITIRTDPKAPAYQLLIIVQPEPEPPPLPPETE